MSVSAPCLDLERLGIFELCGGRNAEKLTKRKVQIWGDYTIHLGRAGVALEVQAQCILISRGILKICMS